MTVEKKGTNYYIISDIINGYLEVRQYIGYSRREAVWNFKEEFKID